jgi:hypothetical protein
MDDNVSDAYRPVLWREYARVVRRSAVLTADDWRRLDYAARAIAVRDARSYASGPDTLAAIDGVLALLDRGAAGDWPSDAERAAASTAARATWVAQATAWAVEAAAEGSAAAWAAEAAVRAAAGSAAAAEGSAAAAANAAATWAVAWPARWAAEETPLAAATDRITHAILAAVDVACERAE